MQKVIGKGQAIHGNAVDVQVNGSFQCSAADRAPGRNGEIIMRKCAQIESCVNGDYLAGRGHADESVSAVIARCRIYSAYLITAHASDTLPSTDVLPDTANTVHGDR